MLNIKSLDGADELFEFCLPEFTEAKDLEDYVQRIIDWHSDSHCHGVFIEGRGGDRALQDEVRSLRTKYPFWPGTWVIFDFGDRYLKRDLICESHPRKAMHMSHPDTTSTRYN